VQGSNCHDASYYGVWEGEWFVFGWLSFGAWCQLMEREGSKLPVATTVRLLEVWRARPTRFLWEMSGAVGRIECL
jgi:hypothetical protein